VHLPPDKTACRTDCGLFRISLHRSNRDSTRFDEHNAFQLLLDEVISMSVSTYAVPSGYGHAEIPLDGVEGKSLKSIHVYQDEDALNFDLEFEDKSLLEMIFRVGFRASVKLLDNTDGDYHLRKRIKPIVRSKIE
jgi:hypothetical protein